MRPFAANPTLRSSNNSKTNIKIGNTHAGGRWAAVQPALSAAVLLRPSTALAALPDPATLATSLDIIDSTTALVGAGAVALGGLLVAAVSSGTGSQAKVVATTAPQAWEALGADERTVLVDIRGKADAKDDGTPDLRPLDKKLLAYPYTKVLAQRCSSPAWRLHARCRSHIDRTLTCRSRRPRRDLRS